uniref:Uncharacterized protein n=1 Tax=uncultured organism MedDCM-OCT-S08-C199 TaxID=743635 RepID=D6PJ80_9ZZZZ|nr:hypothetical protein [uncultured organism MedDCM-OCT-S08-C199]
MCELNRLMYFRHDADSFNATGKWLTELRDHADSNIVVLLAGNKTTLHIYAQFQPHKHNNSPMLKVWK